MNFADKIGWQYFIKPLKEWNQLNARTGLKEFWVFQAYVTVILILLNLIPIYYYMPLDWYFNMVGLDEFMVRDIFALLADSPIFQTIPELENRLVQYENWILSLMHDGIKHYYLQTLAALYLMFPGLAILFRRFHDIGRSGWWHLLIFVLPPFGSLIVLIATLQDSQKQANTWGEPPSKI